MDKTCDTEGYDLALLLIRLPLGIIFMVHGSQKVFGLFGGHGVPATIKAFEGMGIPAFMTILAMLAEFGGGVGVFFGFLTRVSGLGIASVMAVAIWKVHWVNGFFLNATCQPGKGHGFEYNLALIGMALALIFGGSGRWGLDRAIWRREGGS